MDKVAMISMPMNGLTDEEMNKNFNKAKSFLEQFGYKVIDTVFSGSDFSENTLEIKHIKQRGVYFIAKSLEAMSYCDVVYFCKGWKNARGCQIEHQVAKNYNVGILYE